MKRAGASLLAAGLLAAAPACAAEFAPSPPTDVVEIASRPGVTERYGLWMPLRPPKAVALLFIGGEGVANIRDKLPGNYAARGNFLPRSRDWFRKRGIAVAVLDAPSDRKGGLVGRFRSSPEHAEDIAAAIADLRRRASGVPVWLVGTSMGTISAASGGAHLQGERGADGIVLTSPVTRNPSPRAQAYESVLEVNLSAIRIPTLVVYHQNDACTAVSVADDLVGRLRNAPRKELLLFTGGDRPESGPCEPLAPHGFWGIEERVVNAIADWILTPKS